MEQITVASLIEKLSQFPKDYIVKGYDSEGDFELLDVQKVELHKEVDVDDNGNPFDRDMKEVLIVFG